MPGYRWTLRDKDGANAGEVSLSVVPKAGEAIILSGNRHVTVTAVIPENIGHR